MIYDRHLQKNSILVLLEICHGSKEGMLLPLQWLHILYVIVIVCFTTSVVFVVGKGGIPPCLLPMPLSLLYGPRH